MTLSDIANYSRYEASCGLSATAELLVKISCSSFVMDKQMNEHKDM